MYTQENNYLRPTLWVHVTCNTNLHTDNIANKQTKSYKRKLYTKEEVEKDEEEEENFLNRIWPPIGTMEVFDYKRVVLHPNFFIPNFLQ